jgi:hypothetical protein
VWVRVSPGTTRCSPHTSGVERGRSTPMPKLGSVHQGNVPSARCAANSTGSARYGLKRSNGERRAG